MGRFIKKQATANSSELPAEQTLGKSTGTSSTAPKSYIVDTTEQALKDGETGFMIIGGVRPPKKS